MSLIKQHIHPQTMKFQVTSIEFDFEDADYIIIDNPDPDLTTTQYDIIEEVMDTIWEADDEEDLVEEITAATGWCIKSIDYRHILNTH